jgi:hypothetical protein
MTTLSFELFVAKFGLILNIFQFIVLMEVCICYFYVTCMRLEVPTIVTVKISLLGCDAV